MIETVNARAAARGLSEDLADTNRRLQQAQSKLLRARTLSMIAEMASGAAHELNSPLTVISGRAQMLGEMTENPEFKRTLELIQNKAHECSRIVTELMDFARPRVPVSAQFDIGELIREEREAALQAQRLDASSFVLDLPASPVRLTADREQVRIVMHELIANACDALAEQGGHLTVRCRQHIADETVEVTVHDSGPGMDAATLERAFDPFFSHRQAGRRRGFGLPRAHRIVESHGGRIWLESRRGEGTTAHVLLPGTPRTVASPVQE
jgi:signal transduction histidine kinase